MCGEQTSPAISIRKQKSVNRSHGSSFIRRQAGGEAAYGVAVGIYEPRLARVKSGVREEGQMITRQPVVVKQETAVFRPLHVNDVGRMALAVAGDRRKELS